MNARRFDRAHTRRVRRLALLATASILLLGAQGALAAIQYTEVYPPVTLDATGPRAEYPVVFPTADGDRTFVISAEQVLPTPTTFRRDVDAAAATAGDGLVRFVSAASIDAQRLLLGDAVFTGSDPASWQADRANGGLARVTGVFSGGMYAGRSWGGLFRGQAGYVGVEMPVTGGSAYGWIRVSLGSSSATVTSVTVYGYAFEDTANVDLAAGAGAANYPPLFTWAPDLSVFDAGNTVGDSVGFVRANDGDWGADSVGITYSIVGGTGVGLFAIDPATGVITLTAAGVDALDSQTTPSYTLTVQADDGQAANNTATHTLTVSVIQAIRYTPVDPPVTLNATTAGETYDLMLDTVDRGPIAYTVRALTIDTGPDFRRQVGIYSGRGDVRVDDGTEDGSRLAAGAWVDGGTAWWSVFSAVWETGNLAWESGTGGVTTASGGNFRGQRGFVGVMLAAGADGEPAFGWVDLEAAADASSVTIYAYAVNVRLFDDIQTGAGAPPPANNPPSFTSAATFDVPETATDNGATLHDVDADDGDGGAGDAGVTYSITGGTGAALFAVDAITGVITLTAAGAAVLDFETTTSYTLTVQADDGQASNNTATQTLTVSVTDVVTAVTAGQSFGVGELAVNGAVVGSVATSGDAPAGFSLTAGNTGGAFAISGAGQLTVADAGAIDFETGSSYSLTVQVTDGSTLSTGTVTINVTDVGTAVAAGQSFNVSETATNGTVLGSVATSGDAPMGFSLTAGNTGGAFAISGAGQLTVADAGAIDFETGSSYSLTVRVTDGSTFATGTVTVSVTDVGIAVAVGQSFTVTETAANGAVLGSVATSGDSPAGFSITGGNGGGAFAIDGSGRVTVAAALDFETTPNYALTVQVSDGTSAATGTVTVSVTDVGLTVPAGQSFAVSEMAANGAVLGSVATTGDAPTGFSLTGGNTGGAFAIDAAGQITVADATALDFGVTPSYTLTVAASDGTTTATGTVTVAVNNVGPTITAGQTFPVAELAANGTVLGSVATTGGAPVGFSITAGDPGGVFAIDATGRLTVAAAAALDFETTPSYTLTVRATDGTTPSTGTVAISVLDVAAVVTAGQSFSVSEAAANGTVLGSVTTTGDTPAGFSITAGAPGGVFAIDAAGRLSVADGTALDYETVTGFTLTVQVTDGTGSASQTVTVGVVNVNEVPVFTSAAGFGVSELAAADGATLFDVQAHDGDGGVSDAGVAYSIVGGTGAGLFAIAPAGGAVTLTAAGAAALDYEAVTSYTLQVQADDGQASSNTATQTLTVSVTDVATAVTANQRFTVSEAAAAGTVVGRVATTGDEPTGFSLTAGNGGGAFAVDATGQLTVAAALDFETTPAYALTVQATDGTAAASAAVTVSLTNVNEPPVLAVPLPDRGATVGMPFAYAVPAGAFTDPDAGDTLTFTATLANDTPLPGWLAFAGATRSFSGTPALADLGTVSVKVTATDGGGLSAYDTFDLAVAETHFPPTLTVPADQSTAEFQPVGPLAFTVNDPDTALGSLVVSAASDNPTLLPNSGIVLGGTNPDRTITLQPAPGQVGVAQITVTVGDGDQETQAAFSLTVTRVHPAPVLFTTAGEELVPGEAVSCDCGGILTLRAADGSGNFRFEILSVPPGAGTPAVFSNGDEHTFVASQEGAFAGEYRFALVDEETGREVEITYEVPFVITAARTQWLDTDRDAVLTLHGGAVGDTFTCEVLDAAGQPDLAEAIAVAAATPAADDAAAGNPARVALTPTLLDAVVPFRVQCSDTFQPDLEPVTTDLLRLVPSAAFGGHVLTAEDGAPVAGAQVRTVRLLDVRGEPYAAVTDADGRFLLSLPRGSEAYTVFAFSAPGFAPRRVAAADVLLEAGAAALPEVRLTAPERTVTGVILGLGDGEVAEIAAEYRDTAGVLQTTPAAQVTGDGSGSDGFTLGLAALYYPRFTLHRDQRFAAAQDNQGQGYDLTGPIAPAVTFSLATERRYLGAEIAPPAGAAAAVRFEETALHTDLAEHTARAFDVRGTPQEPLSVTRTGDTLVAAFGAAGALRLCLLDETGRIVATVSHDPDGGADVGPRGTAQVLAGGGARVRFDAAAGAGNPRPSYVEVELASEGLDSSGLGCEPPPATLEVRTREAAAVGWVPLFTNASQNRVTQVELHVGNCRGGLATVGVQGAEVVLPPLVLTLPFDPLVVGLGDLEAGRFRLYHAPDLASFLAGQVDAVPPEDLMDVDLLNGTVSYRLGHLSVFGIGLDGLAPESSDAAAEPTGSGGRSTACFLSALHGEEDGLWTRLVRWVQQFQP